MKTSKLKRKQLNRNFAELASFGAVARPSRQFRVPPTFGRADTKTFHIGSCERPLGEQQVRTGRFRRSRTVTVPCGGRLMAKLGSLCKRRVYCESCRARRREAQKLQRLERSLTKLGHFSQRESTQDTGRLRFLSRLRRSGER